MKQTPQARCRLTLRRTPLLQRADGGCQAAAAHAGPHSRAWRLGACSFLLGAHSRVLHLQNTEPPTFVCIMAVYTAAPTLSWDRWHVQVWRPGSGIPRPYNGGMQITRFLLRNRPQQARPQVSLAFCRPAPPPFTRRS
jgi:hypothetical protein